MNIAVVAPRARGARRIFDYLRVGAAYHDVNVAIIRPELARVTRFGKFDAVIAGDPALAAQLPYDYDAVVVHDVGPHRSPQLFRGVYAPPGVKRDNLDTILSRSEVVTFSSITAKLLDEVAGVPAEVVKPGIDIKFWKKYGADDSRYLADVGAIIPSTDPVTKGLPMFAELKDAGLKTLVVTDTVSLDNWTSVHLIKAADVVVFEPEDEELAKLRTRAWLAPGFEGFGLAPLEMHVATGAVPVWTYDPDLGKDDAKPPEFQVKRSPEGVRELKALIDKQPAFPVTEFTAERFAERFINAL